MDIDKLLEDAPEEDEFSMFVPGLEPGSHVVAVDYPDVQSYARHDTKAEADADFEREVVEAQRLSSQHGANDYYKVCQYVFNDEGLDEDDLDNEIQTNIGWMSEEAAKAVKFVGGIRQ